MLNEISIFEYGKIFVVKDILGRIFYYIEIEFNKLFRGINSILENII